MKSKPNMMVMAVVLLLVGVMSAQQNQTNPNPDNPKAAAEDSQLKVVHRVPPIYPPEAKAKGISGTLVVDAVIDKQGNVVSAKVIEGDKIFWDAALTAIRAWKFEPTKSQRQEKTTIKIRFSG